MKEAESMEGKIGWFLGFYPFQRYKILCDFTELYIRHGAKSKMPTINSHLQLYKTLREEKVKYLVIGRVAVVLYGVPVSTFDLDLLIEPSEENCERLIKGLTQAGFKGAKALSIHDFLEVGFATLPEHIKLDIFAAEDEEKFKQLWRRRKIMQIHYTKINVISMEDLIELKKRSGKKKDREDVRNLKRILRETSRT